MRLQAAEAATTSASSTVSRTALPVEPPVHRVLELEQIVVTGNSHISDSEILSTLGLAPHDTVNVTILEDARLRLLKDFPLLKSVDLSTSPGSRRGLIILDIAVVERNPVVFETGYGLHDTYGWFLTLLGIRIDPAAAYGTEYRLGLRLGFHIAGLDGEFEQHPKPGRIGLGGNFHLYSQDQLFFAGESAPGTWDVTDTTHFSRQFRQKIYRSGAEFYLFSRLADSTKFSFGYHVEGVRPESSFVESENGQKYQFADFPSSLQAGIKNTTITGSSSGSFAIRATFPPIPGQDRSDWCRCRPTAQSSAETRPLSKRTVIFASISASVGGVFFRVDSPRVSSRKERPTTSGSSSEGCTQFAASAS